jgi:Ca2+-binding EF-hand superfamily protein
MSRQLLWAALPALLLAWCAQAAPPAPPAAAPAGSPHDFVYLGDTRPILIRMNVSVEGRPLQAVWDDFVGSVFKYLDADGDGVLSREEAGRLPPPQVLFNNFGFGGGGAVPFAALDANKDGKVSRDELARYFRTSGAAPFQLRSGNQANGMGGFRVRLAGQVEPLSPDAVNKLLFDLLDTNKDGKLSKEELEAGPARLMKLDANDDEMITPEELNPNSVPEGDDTFTAVAFVDATGAMPDTGSFVAVNAGEPSKDLARRLLNQYGPKGKTGAAKKLTRKDLGLDEATFARLDADGDGALDLEELARFAQRPADLELQAGLGKKGGNPALRLVEPKGGPSPLAKQVRKQPAGGLELDLGVTHLQFGNFPDNGGMTGISFVPPVAVDQQYKMAFKEADMDANGYLDKEEARKSPIFQGLFALMDRDGDGKLYYKEVEAFLAKMKDLQAGAASSFVSLGVSQQGNGLFDLLDTNRDRRLSLREMRQMVKLIGQLDRDGDGRIGRDEIPRSFQLSLQQGPDNGGFFAGNVFVARTFGGMGQPMAARPAAGPTWFHKMDRNGDGDVSRREFLGSDAEFDRIDLDKDGLISLEEAIKADQQMRKDKGRKP